MPTRPSQEVLDRRRHTMTSAFNLAERHATTHGAAETRDQQIIDAVHALTAEAEDRHFARLAWGRTIHRGILAMQTLELHHTKTRVGCAQDLGGGKHLETFQVLDRAFEAVETDFIKYLNYPSNDDPSPDACWMVMVSAALVLAAIAPYTNLPIIDDTPNPAPHGVAVVEAVIDNGKIQILLDGRQQGTLPAHHADPDATLRGYGLRALTPWNSFASGDHGIGMSCHAVETPWR